MQDCKKLEEAHELFKTSIPDSGIRFRDSGLQFPEDCIVQEFVDELGLNNVNNMDTTTS